MQQRGAPAAACFVLVAAALASPPSFAQRQAVLKQIDVPHNYYFREMYLPQLTNGPSSVAFSPDGRALVYSMQGSLWKQALDSRTAEQLTSGPGYDYQPDWSPDGTRILFTRYVEDSMELYLLDLATGRVKELTHTHAVNLEPRWSPDGRQLAWVSTAGSGHFHVFVGAVDGDGVQPRQAWPERRSRISRYYYSPFDHELSPTWSPDGKEIIYVGNPEIAYGTGSLWRRGVSADAEPVLVRQEETTWKARPAWSPDGKRVLWSSYAGRQWHQLWLTTAAGGGDAFPITYGEFDNTSARWSPDGSLIAFVSNRSGSTEIWLQETVGAAQRKLEIRERRHLQAMGQLHLQTVDSAGKAIAARVSIVASDGRMYAPDDAWIHADDGFDRHRRKFEVQYFHSAGDSRITLPPGPTWITVWRGMEHEIARQMVTIAADKTADLRVTLQPLALPQNWSRQWQSADVHVHMNYGGAYRASPDTLVRQADAEDLDVVFNLVVNKEQRFPDIDYFSTAPDKASTVAVLLTHSQEFHTSYWGHLGLLGLTDHLLLPGYSAYINTAAASLYPTNGAIADLAHAQHALVGYVHPFDETPDPKASAPLTNALPVDVALGKVDYYEVLGFSEHRTSAAVWYRLLNCGFKPAAAAGTDAMTNFASLRGPVGMNRVYALTEPADTPASRASNWLAALRAGRTMATNGPLLGLTVNGQPPGSQIRLSGAKGTLRYEGFLRSAVPIDHLELIVDGNVARTIRLDRKQTSASFEGTLNVSGNGWLLVRAWNDEATPDILDLYPYATTNAVFFRAEGEAARCGVDAEYFLAWLARLEAAAGTHEGYNTPREREATLAEIRAAREVFDKLR